MVFYQNERKFEFLSHSPVIMEPMTMLYRSPAPAGAMCPPPVFSSRRHAPAFAVLAAAVLVAAASAQGWLGGGSLSAPQPVPPGQDHAVAESERLDGRRLQPVARLSHVVQPGDTLWSIARDFVPEGDIRPLVDRLAAARGNTPLQPGEAVVLTE